MPKYDAQRFEPPAPVARVVLRNSTSGARQADVPMLLDTGADVTLIPETVADLLGIAAIPDRRYELISFDGSTSFARVVRADLILAHRTFRGQFLLIDRAWGILGRNILNAIPLLLDGPNLVWDERRSR